MLDMTVMLRYVEEITRISLFMDDVEVSIPRQEVQILNFIVVKPRRVTIGTSEMVLAIDDHFLHTGNLLF